ncbi:MAG: DDE-type integrase/transposase/recombinase, partial [Candidatus Binatia bacterium]
MDGDRHEHRDERARLRFAIISSLLAAPPERGELKKALEGLSKKTWRDPLTGLPVHFGFSTIEQWYYRARSAPKDPIGALRDRVRADRGRRSSVSEAIAKTLRQQHREHPSWSYTLHADNLHARAREEDELAPVPSTSTLRRWMKANGLFKQRRRKAKNTEGAELAARRFQSREVRGYQSSHVHALWHADFHQGSRRVLLPEGRFAGAFLLGILDDCSRLCCHAQWYLAENAEALVHGLVQAILKRGLPRSLMTDRGSAMGAAETQRGLEALGITWKPTLPYSPYQNGKQESWWSNVEGHLLAMLEGVEDLSLDLLNEATQAWV